MRILALALMAMICAAFIPGIAFAGCYNPASCNANANIAGGASFEFRPSQVSIPASNIGSLAGAKLTYSSQARPVLQAFDPGSLGLTYSLRIQMPRLGNFQVPGIDFSLPIKQIPYAEIKHEPACRQCKTDCPAPACRQCEESGEKNLAESIRVV